MLFVWRFVVRFYKIHVLCRGEDIDVKGKYSSKFDIISLAWIIFDVNIEDILRSRWKILKQASYFSLAWIIFASNCKTKGPVA